MEKNLKDLIDERLEVLSQIQGLEEKVETIKNKLAVVDAQITAVIEGPVGEARKLANKLAGTVDVLVQGVMVKHNLPKKVEWDQEKLAGIKSLILEHDDNPDEYLVTKTKTTYSVLEKKYERFSPEVKAVFNEARTVKTGEAKVSFNMNWR